MEERSKVVAAIDKFFEALIIDDASDVPLAKNVEYYGVFSPKPSRGDSNVRDYIQQIAPFMLNESYGQMIVENGSVAVTAKFDSVNGLHNEGAFFFEVSGGEILQVRAIFDTKRMFHGKES